jgi:hypothetical protein
MKNEQIVPMILPSQGGRDKWVEGLDRKKANNQEEAQLRSLAFTPPK